MTIKIALLLCCLFLMLFIMTIIMSYSVKGNGVLSDWTPRIQFTT